MANDEPWIPNEAERKQFERDLDRALREDFAKLVDRYTPDQHD